MDKQDLKNSLPVEELQQAKLTINLLVRATKMCSLYNQRHPNVLEIVEQFHENLTAFVSTYGEFALEVKKDQIYYQDEMLYSGAACEGDLAYILFRDGLRSVTFLEGIDYDETEVFVMLLNKYKRIPVESEDDLVTALWEAQLRNIHYLAVENRIDADSPRDTQISSHSSGGDMTASPSNESNPQNTPFLPTATSGATELCQESVADLMIPSPELNSEEMAILQAMIVQEEEMNPTQELIDIIEDIFCDQTEEELFSVVFDFFKVELRNALVKVQFDIAVNLIKGLRHLCTLSEKEKPWFQSKSKDVFLSIASPVLLADLLQAWENCEIQQMEQMKQVLLLLPPEASIPLVFTLLDKSSPTTKNMLTDVIKHLLIEDQRLIEAQLTTAHESALENLVGILGEIEGETPVKLLIAITRYDSEKVRVKILKTLMSRKVWAPESLFQFIENESSAVRYYVLKYLGTRKCTTAEKLLLNYLKSKKFRSDEKGYIFSCFRALGLCGSDRSIPFLREVLTKGWVISKFSKSLVRQGAAIALNALGSDEAKQIIRDAAESYFPGVRSDIKAAFSNPGE